MYLLNKKKIKICFLIKITYIITVISWFDNLKYIIVWIILYFTLKVDTILMLFEKWVEYLVKINFLFNYNLIIIFICILYLEIIYRPYSNIT